VRACQSLFETLNLGSKYLSELVTEETVVSDGRERASLTRHMRERAYALGWWVVFGVSSHTKV
jgi:hypothetical protein